MPKYEYACKDCGEHLEVVQSFSDASHTECPTCGGPLRKVFGNIGVVFKGSGFYKTDSREKSRSGANGARSDKGDKAEKDKSDRGDKAEKDKSDKSSSSDSRSDSASSGKSSSPKASSSDSDKSPSGSSGRAKPEPKAPAKTA